MGFPDGSVVKNSSANAGDMQVQPLGQEDPLEEEMAGILQARILEWVATPAPSATAHSLGQIPLSLQLRAGVTA